MTAPTTCTGCGCVISAGDGEPVVREGTPYHPWCTPEFRDRILTQPWWVLEVQEFSGHEEWTTHFMAYVDGELTRFEGGRLPLALGMDVLKQIDKTRHTFRLRNLLTGDVLMGDLFRHRA